MPGSNKAGDSCIFVAARPIPLPRSPWIEMVLVEKGDDAADREIIRLAARGDLIVTRDIPLAAELVGHNYRVINDRGRHYTEENIRPRLSERNFMAELRALGLASIKDSGFSPREVHHFASTFDRELTNCIAAALEAATIESAESEGAENEDEMDSNKNL